MQHARLFRRAFGAELLPEAIERLSRHAELLERWNRVVRLVGEDGPEAWIGRHYAESVAARPLWPPSTIGSGKDSALLDVGSGAGFPGLVLAALHPERSVTLVEARERKAAFLAEASRELELPRVRVIHKHLDVELATALAGAVECASIRGLRLPDATMACLVDSLPAGGRLIVWAGRHLAPGLLDLCAVEEEMKLPDSQHRRIVLLRPLRRG